MSERAGAGTAGRRRRPATVPIRVDRTDQQMPIGQADRRPAASAV